MKRIIPLILVIVMCFNMGGTAFAATGDEDSTKMLIGSYQLPASVCRSIYYEYVGFYGDYTDVTTALADVLSNSGLYTYSAAVSIASSLGAIYATYVMDATYAGWQSGRGATLYVYDNTTPIILAN